MGAALNDYRADAWSVNNDTEFFARSQDSFYKRSDDKRVQAKKLQERNEELAKQRTIEERRQRDRLEEEYIENLNYNRSFLKKTRISDETMEEMLSALRKQS